jgi:hypothetical protein
MISDGMISDGSVTVLTKKLLATIAGSVLYAVQAPFKRTLLAGKPTHATWRSKPS